MKPSENKKREIVKAGAFNFLAKRYSKSQIFATDFVRLAVSLASLIGAKMSLHYIHHCFYMTLKLNVSDSDILPTFTLRK